VRTIYKYAIPEAAKPFALDLPTGAELVRVDMQFDQACLWALVDTDAPPERRTFLRTVTGAPLPAGELRVIGTAMRDGGQRVSHLIELLSPQDVDAPAAWYEIELEARLHFAHDARNLVSALAGRHRLIAAASPGEDTSGYLEENARTHDALERLVGGARGSGTISEAEAAVLLGEDVGASRQLLLDIWLDARGYTR
jgi:hypothetical protein